MQAAMPLACFLSMIRPPGIQFENSLLQIAPVDKAKCPFVRDHNDIEFRLYTRHNPTVYQELYIDDDEKLFASNLDYHAPTVLYFHAFMENPDDGSAAMVREAYVLRGDTNVIMVDASRLEAGPWYFTAAENTWYIGKFAAQFVDYLVSRGLNLNNTHFVGHSLGAQAAGVAGSALKTGRVSRITGLDPALPLFHGLPAEQRLDTSDADFVDIIHTDGGIFGVNRPMGHADFYPNGGISPQPGCELEVVIPQQMLLNKFFCSHWRSYMFYAESVIRPDAFAASSCASWKHYARGGCAHAQTAHMGFGDTNTEPSGFYAFYLSPNKITKNSIILERRLQKFFTKIQALKSNVKSEVEPMTVDNRGLIFLKTESQRNPALIKVETFERPIKTNKKNLEAEESIKEKEIKPQEIFKSRDRDPSKNLKTSYLEPHNIQKSMNLDASDQTAFDDQIESIDKEKLKPQEIFKSRDTDPSKNLKTSYLGPHNIQKYMNLDASDQTAFDDQIMVESVSKYRVLKPDYFKTDDFNSGTMKPIVTKKNDKLIVENSDDNYKETINKKIGSVSESGIVNSKEIENKKNEKVSESGIVGSQDETQKLGLVLDEEPLRLDLDRYIMPRVERYYRNFAKKEGTPRNIKEVTITQMPPYSNQDIGNIPEHNSKIQTPINSEKLNDETFKQEFQSKKSWQNSQEQSQIDINYQEQSEFDSKTKQKSKIGSNPQETSLSDSKPEKQIQLDSKSQGQSQLDSKPQEQSQFDPKPQKQSETDSKPQEQSQLDKKPQEKSQLDPKPQKQSQFDPKPQQQSETDSKPQEKTQLDPKPQQKSQINSDSSTKYRNHVFKRQKRFLNPFKSAETDQQDNFLFKLLDFVFKHRSKIPVYSVMREINTLVKSAHGELNHISKERNNYIGAPPPTLIPVSYTLELANENKVTAFVKKLLGLAPKGDRLTINGK